MTILHLKIVKKRNKEIKKEILNIFLDIFN